MRSPSYTPRKAEYQQVAVLPGGPTKKLGVPSLLVRSSLSRARIRWLYCRLDFFRRRDSIDSGDLLKNLTRDLNQERGWFLVVVVVVDAMAGEAVVVVVVVEELPGWVERSGVAVAVVVV